MKIRNELIVAAVAIATLGLTSPSAWAGSPQQHRWEGVAIGVGAAILGSALIHHHGIHIYTPARTVHSPRAPFRGHPPKIRHPGHWRPHYRDHHRHWKRYHQKHEVFSSGRYKGRMVPNNGYRQPGNRSPFHGPTHHRHGSGAGNHHKDRRY